MKKYLILFLAAAALLAVPAFAQTRFYLPAAGTPAISINWSAYWNYVAASRLLAPASKTKTSTDITIFDVMGNAANSPGAGAQYITGQLAAYNWTTADEIKLQVQMYTGSGTGAYLATCIRVVSSDGGTVRGTLYSGNGPTDIVAGAVRNRSLGAAGAHIHVAGSVTQQAGDRLVIELGAVFTASIYPYLNLGDNSATDLPEDETDAGDKNPWIEFSPTIADYSAASPATVTTTAISKVTHAVATSGGNVTDAGGGTISARGVCWNTSTLPTTANSKTTDAGTTGVYTSAVTGLSVATTYHLRAYATNEAGTAYGSEVDFTTDTLSDISDAVFTVTESTGPVVTGLSDSTVIVGQTITITGTSFGASGGYVKWGAQTALVSSWADTSIVCLVPVDTVAGNLVVTTSAYLSSAGTAYTMATPTVTTTAISAILNNTATSGGNVTDQGDAAVTAKGVCWGTAPYPTTANAKTVNGSGTGSFTSAIVGLNGNTVYHLRSYATNSSGTGYGVNVSFTTSRIKAAVALLLSIRK